MIQKDLQKFWFYTLIDKNMWEHTQQSSQATNQFLDKNIKTLPLENWLLFQKCVLNNFGCYQMDGVSMFTQSFQKHIGAT